MICRIRPSRLQTACCRDSLVCYSKAKTIISNKLDKPAGPDLQSFCSKRMSNLTFLVPPHQPRVSHLPYFAYQQIFFFVVPKRSNRFISKRPPLCRVTRFRPDLSSPFDPVCSTGSSGFFLPVVAPCPHCPVLVLEYILAPLDSFYQ